FVSKILIRNVALPDRIGLYRIEKVSHEKMNALRPFWILAGILATALGIIGIALPLLPTTPFLLLAAFAFARSSPQLHKWLVNHRRFGPLIRNWQRHGAISRRAKIPAIFAMAIALLITWLGGFDLRILAIQALVMVCVALFILTRPEGPRR